MSGQPVISEQKKLTYDAILVLHYDLSNVVTSNVSSCRFRVYMYTTDDVAHPPRQKYAVHNMYGRKYYPRRCIDNTDTKVSLCICIVKSGQDLNLAQNGIGI